MPVIKHLFLLRVIMIRLLTFNFLFNLAEEKKKESSAESEDDDMGFGLFD